MNSLKDFRPISPSNITYKVVAKVITQRLKKVLSKIISHEKFGVLENRQIHEAIGVSQEGMHSIKLKKTKGAILKIDLSKYFDRVSWLYLRLLLTHLGFNYSFIKWIFPTSPLHLLQSSSMDQPLLLSCQRGALDKDAHSLLLYSYW